MLWLRFCLSMDLKKLAFSDQFPYWVSRRRKVVSGFGFGVLAFLIVLSVVLFNVSFKAPFLSPVFRGFNSFHVSNISIVPWHFSFPSTSAPSSSSSTANTSSGASSTNSTVPTDEEFQKSEGLIPRVREGEVFDKAHKANGSVMGKDGNIPGSDGEGINSGVTPVGNFSDKFKNGSSLEEEGMGEEKSQFVNGLGTGENAGFKNDYEEGAGLERTHLGNSSEKVRSESFNGGDMVRVKGVTQGNVDETHANESISLNKPPRITVNSNIGMNKVNDNGGNWSHKGNVGCPGKELCFSEIQNQKLSSETNNIAASYNNSRPMEVHNGSYGKCDLFDGRWVRDYTKPYYPAGSCPYIDRDFDCHLNRRPDDGFVKWKWQPYGCDIPSLNATDFLERLRGKNLVFVGDSLNRNMWESLVCILRHSIHNKKRVYEISGRRDFKKKGFYAFRFEDYNCSVDFVSSPFLVRESSFIGRNGSFETLRLDLMDRTTSMYRDADVVVFNTGHWWTHEKTSRGEDYYQEGKHVYPRLKVLEAYKKALYTWARWVDKNIDSSRTEVIFRGYSVTHFRGGQWNSGGQCHKETEPFFNETYLANYPSKMRVLEHVLREMKTPVIYLNISRLTDYRKDGHPSIYRKEYKTVKEQIAAEQSQDCSHWCLPGVPDTWNELLYFSLLQAGKGSWRS